MTLNSPAATTAFGKDESRRPDFHHQCTGRLLEAVGVFCGSPRRRPCVPKHAAGGAAAGEPRTSRAAASSERPLPVAPRPSPPGGQRIRPRSGRATGEVPTWGEWRAAAPGCGRRGAGSGGARNRGRGAAPPAGSRPGPGGGGRSLRHRQRHSSGAAPRTRHCQEGVPVPALRRGTPVPLMAPLPPLAAGLSLLSYDPRAVTSCFWKGDAGSAFRARVHAHPQTPHPASGDSSQRGSRRSPASVTLILVAPSAGVTLPPLPVRIPPERIP